MENIKLIDVDVLYSILAHNVDGIMITDHDNVIICANDAFADMMGYEVKDMVGKTPAMFSSGRQDLSFYKQMWEDIINSGGWKGELWNKHHNGQMIPIQITITAIYVPGTKIVKNYVVIARDIAELKQYESELRELAFYDPLTGLYNRRLFAQFLDEHIAILKRGGSACALVLIDLDDFGDINNTYGHNDGDIILKHVAECIQRVFKRDGDIIARIGGDEFMVLITGIDHTADISQLCETVCHNFVNMINEPVDYFGKQVCISASVGVAFGTSDITSSNELYERADQAMYKVKKHGKASYAVYEMN